IEEENIGRIFQKFYQVDSSMTRHFEGTGIGLSIASSVVEAHNGHIDVQSKSNEGTTFIITFSKSSFEWENLSRTDNSLDGKSVYVINSNEEFRGICATMLSDMGAQVKEFDSGYDAHRNAVRELPDAVLLGETLPDLSGIEALELFCTSDDTRSVAALLMLTKSPTGDTQIEAHESQIVWKPFSSYELIQRVRSLVSDAHKESRIV
ncbi:MAG: ATP-binding protein, partial [Candidatus Hydrogenedentota bacterium]